MRYCMFCGEQIPDNAVFCPSCGARQPEPEVKEEKKETLIEEDDGDNIALSLLSKANFVSNKGTGKPIIPQYEPKPPEKKAKKVDADGKVIPSENTEKTPEEEVKINTPSIKKMEEMANAIPDVQIMIKQEEELDEEDAEMMSRMMEMMDRGSSYVPPILSDINEEIKEQKIKENYEQLTAKKSDSSSDSDKEEKPAEEVHTEYKNAPKPVYKKRNLLEDEEDEDEESYTAMSTSSSINTDIRQGLTADEIADIEKYKKYDESDDKKKDEDLKPNKREGRTEKGEGRKATGHKKEIRRNIDKEIQERDIRDIEHEEVANKDEINKDYDGYYENVKPIDFDKMHDNSAMVKTVITGGSVIIIACVIFYAIITFFLQ